VNDTEFRSHAVAYMTKIFDHLESNFPNFDLEDDEESITIEASQNRQFLINIHPISKQIWYSSPLSGAHHFAPTPSGDWIDTRNGNELLSFLNLELKTLG